MPLNLPLALIENPKGALPSHKFGWAGRIPAALCDKQYATWADILAGRSVKGDDGSYYVLVPRSYPTREAALADAAAHGIMLDPDAEVTL